LTRVGSANEMVAADTFYPPKFSYSESFSFLPLMVLSCACSKRKCTDPSDSFVRAPPHIKKLISYKTMRIFLVLSDHTFKPPATVIKTVK
jgi:hypothetical protein